ncbi:3-phosphoshikimate 1-carboxyvinyltransferase [Pseudomonas songnenensis]|uniref:3-phosphoshikimate 1-carboxyvinyltransferase n=1 Tax=Pseudomonas songnenensis TaxID=1176259 RepID=A0ABX9UPA5_9PSED|nr:3-phosphoshikimate 1-carboxyvinyltransferase [Pseudomonas songnenensis]MCQ4299304.1 3-phosphoshikimate 1-carboxyvinyltransferase [Pseudomonas songnenensis]RMH94645.1 3-phosphoshikimate 1-carboxyvinyltransferase [Pseudomonas songnenensis]
MPSPIDEEHTPYPKPYSDLPIDQDPFIRGLKQRLPQDLRESFSDEQLEALRGVFGARSWVKHRIDLRGTIRLWSDRYYFAIVAGRNKRNLIRPQQNLSLIAKAALATVFLLFSGLVGLVILYLLKSALGINLFPGFSLGLWDWFKQSL